MPLDALIAPGGTATHAAEPACGAYVPTPQAWQTIVDTFRKVPAAHCTQLVKSLLLCEPAGQSWHAVAPPPAAKKPTAHGWHAWLVAFMNVPASHCT